MKIQELSISNLRNHRFTKLDFGGSLNIFYGYNGAGKTTVLESLSISSITKSFLPTSDQLLVRNGEKSYSVNLRGLNDLNLPYSISISYEIGGKKKISTNSDDHLLPKDVIGDIPIVILSPDYKSITFGSPQERRSFIDSILCQASKIYMEHLMNLRKCLKQRNNLLALSRKERHFDYSEIEPWTEMLISLSTEIIHRRHTFIKRFFPYFLDSYKLLSSGAEEIGIEYEPYSTPKEVIESGKQSLSDHLSHLSKSLKQNEYRRGTSLFGPQRDDLQILVNKGLAKDYASQGQHKTLLISLKFAEFDFLKEIKNETPILLLDDIFSELDDNRIQKVLELIEVNNAQTFITLTDPVKFVSKLVKSADSKLFFADNGEICEKIELLNNDFF